MKPSHTSKTFVRAGGKAVAPAPTAPKKPHAKAGEVRIIGGAFKRSKLIVPLANGLRPTGDRVRETLFNWLGQDLGGHKCLDAFAGCGALGFEAASRGASTTWLVERDRAALQALNASQAKLNMPGLRVVAGDALSLLGAQKGAGWDVIFLDPPFNDEAVYTQALTFAAGALAVDGYVYLEAPREWLDHELQAFGLRVLKHGKAGAVHFHLLAPWHGQAEPDETEVEA
jgi:16S rRNA (guanine966-N2)-methyltransferase